VCLFFVAAVLDVYVDMKNRVWIIGMSSFGSHTDTDPLLFSWEDFNEDSADSATDGDSPTMLTVMSNAEVLPRDASLGASRGPSDVHLLGPGLFDRNSHLLQGNGSYSEEDD
jgi:hypothetical protein